MGPIDVLADQWRRSCWSDPWHGSSLGSLLREVDPQTAAAHPIVGGHSIWEVVLHLTAWTDEVARRLAGHEPAMPLAGDWPAPPEASAARWQETLDGLAERVGSERDAPLGTGVSHEGLVQGALQHNAYHGGQIALLRKALGL